MLLKGKRALIAGSISGIGAQCARVLAGEGVSVVINGRSADRAAAVTAEIRKVGGQAKFVPGDATTENGSNAVIEGAKSAFDGIDILVDNVGIGPSLFETLLVGAGPVVGETRGRGVSCIDGLRRTLCLWCGAGVGLVKVTAHTIYIYGDQGIDRNYMGSDQFSRKPRSAAILAAGAAEKPLGD